MQGLPSNYKIHTYPNEILGNYRLSNDCSGTLNLYDWNAKNQRLYYSDFQNVASANKVLYNIETTYAYYKKIFNRWGWDNKNGNIDVMLNGEFTRKDSKGKDEQYYSNASFGNGRMRVGNNQGNTDMSNTSQFDDINSIDIIGHEYTHGVVATSSELVYQGESGALNESFADIFGNLIEIDTEGLHSDNVNDKGEVVLVLNSWNIGEDRATASGEGVFRNMANPKKHSQPDTYKGENWDLAEEVHVNSGVQNYFFYLLCMGGSGANDFGDSYNITPIGIEKAQQLAYKTLTALGPTSDYKHVRFTWLSMAQLMYGICSPEFLTVKAAWNAVGVYDVYGEKQYCNTIKEGDLNSNDQITIAGYVSSINANCSAQISTAPDKELIATASNDIIIKPETVITEGSNVILQIDPCDW